MDETGSFIPGTTAAPCARAPAHWPAPCSAARSSQRRLPQGAIARLRRKFSRAMFMLRLSTASRVSSRAQRSTKRSVVVRCRPGTQEPLSPAYFLMPGYLDPGSARFREPSGTTAEMQTRTICEQHFAAATLPGSLGRWHTADLDPQSIPLPFNVFHTCLAEDARAVLDGIAKRLAGESSALPSALPGEGLRAFLLDPKQEILPAHAIATRPASLLLAKHRLVPFDDFHGLREAFVDWATEEPAHALGRKALGRLVHAPAGLGKTRALIEIADALTRQHGWLAGFVPRDIRGAGRELSEDTLERLILGGRDAAGLLLIVDYAESRQDDVVWLADRLVRRVDTIAKPARLVLLSRGSGVWWRELVLKSQSLQELCSLGGDAYDEMTIPQEIVVRDRRALFDSSVIAFRDHGGALTTQARALSPPSGDLLRALESDNDYDRPLAVQIAALLHVAGVDAGEGQGTAGLLDKILGLEYEYWDKALNIRGKPNWQAAIKNGVAQVTLLAGATHSKRQES